MSNLLLVLLVANIAYVSLAFAFKWKFRYLILLISGLGTGLIVGRLAGAF